MMLLIFTALMMAFAARAPLLLMLKIEYITNKYVTLMVPLITLIIWMRVLGIGACGREGNSTCSDSIWIYISLIAAVGVTVLVYGFIKEVRRNAIRRTRSKGS